MNRVSSALITGATGFVGSALVRRLLADQVEVTAVVRDASRIQGIDRQNVTEVRHWEPDALRRALAGKSAEVVFHLASYGVHADQRDPERLAAGNLGVLTNVLHATAQLKPRQFVFAGSCAEYGFPATQNTPISETQPLAPTTPYGAAKALAEKEGAKLAAELGISFATLRLFNVFGPGEAPQRLLPFIIDHLQHDEPAELTGGEQVRDFIYIDDAVEALIMAALSDNLQAGEAYNVCSGRGTSVREVGEIAAEQMGKPRSLLQWGKRPYRRDEPMWLVGDNRRFTEVTGWQPRTTIPQGVARMIAEVRTREVRHAL
jgi:nucleoside-diphosphate-sugar epimerase